jgi:AraC-like DNA-binding protein/tetratricopeptide (TPR) repeat protein
MIAKPHSAAANALLPRGVRRALDAMRADLGRDWTVNDLAAIAGVSGRTLQRQFRIFFGKSPRDALRDFRFECARRELLQGSPDVNVMDVAHDCGLQHCGRFSVEYRRRYDETPSQTLKRQSVLVAALASMSSAVIVPAGAKLMLAVGPIEASAEHGELARHIADELTIALIRAGVSVSSKPGSTRYVLTGAVRGAGRQACLIVRLIETGTGRHLAAHRSDGILDASSAPREFLANRIVAALQPSLRLAEIERADGTPDPELDPYDLALKAMPCVLSLDADGNARAIEFLERAMDRDPNHALATALAAWAYGQRVVYHFSDTPMQDRARGAELARKTQTLTGNATVLAVLGNALTLLHDLEGAGRVVREALAVDGGSSWAWSRSGWIDVYNGNSESAIERFKIALDLAPNDSLGFNSLVGIGCAHFGAGRYVEAARWQQLALDRHPSATWIHRTMCPAYVIVGAKSQARCSVTALRQQYPGLTISEVQTGFPPMPQSYRELCYDALQAAGLPS